MSFVLSVNYISDGPKVGNSFPAGSLMQFILRMRRSLQNKMVCSVHYILSRFQQQLVQTGKLSFLFFLTKKKRKQVFRCTLKVVVQVTLLTFFFFFMYDNDINEKQTTEHGLWKYVARKKLLSLHYLIILLMLPTNWICFCLQSFLAEKTGKSHPYLAHGAGKVLVEEVKPVLSWSSHVLKISVLRFQ